LLIVVGILQQPHQARSVIRALRAAGFELEWFDAQGALLSRLMEIGVCEEDAHFFVAGTRRGWTLVCARAGDAVSAERAADLMDEYGAVDIEGQTPTGPGCIYWDARAYLGPERRHGALPFFGINRRAA
jgi:hypothetical protein